MIVVLLDRRRNLKLALVTGNVISFEIQVLLR
jgi:hypothetical protein